MKRYKVQYCSGCHTEKYHRITSSDDVSVEKCIVCRNTSTWVPADGRSINMDNYPEDINNYICRYCNEIGRCECNICEHCNERSTDEEFLCEECERCVECCKCDGELNGTNV